MSKVKFDYGITSNGKLIALFKVVCDRDYSLDVLSETFDDCEFHTVNDCDVEVQE